jgi:hypothetical protein
MKKILSLILCMMLLFSLPVAVFAEGEDAVVEDTVAEDGGATDEKTDIEIEADKITEQIVVWFQDNFEEISVIITLLLTLFYQVKKHTSLNKSIGTLNNNAVAIAENSGATITQALSGVSSVSAVITDYIGKMDNLLAEVRSNEEDKRAMKAALDTAMKYVEAAKSANIELANELAELLLFANIPVSRKDEFYARHRATVESIASIVGDIDGKKEETGDEETEE